MSRLERTVDFKLEVVNHYLHTSDGQRKTAAIYGIYSSEVRLWTNLYQLHGIAGLQKQHLHFSAKEKELVILYKRDHHLSTRQTAEHFNIHTFSTITNWEKLYASGGLPALNHRKKVKSSIMKPNQPTVSHKLDTDLCKDELLQQLRYLRAEVAYLKKLEALTQQKQKLATKKKQR